MIEKSASSKQSFILVAEDENAYAKVYELKLQKAGYSVQIAENGKKALEYAKKQKPDVMLIDLMMPVMDGFTLLEKLKKESLLKNVPVIVMSNLGQEEDIEKAKRMGAADFLIKSNVTFKEVLQKVKSYL